MIAAGQGYGGVRGEGIRIVVPTPEGAVEAVHAAARSRHGRDAFNTAGNTALHAAVGRGEPVVKLLASRGATLNLKNKAGFTPLDLALGRAAAAGAAASSARTSRPCCGSCRASRFRRPQPARRAGAATP